MGALAPQIVKFIRKHHVLTLGTLAADGTKGELWACNLFYACDQQGDNPILVFTSGKETEHARHFERYPHVAGAIVLETKAIGKLQGLQFQGIVKPGDGNARKVYLKRFPFAAVMLKELWILEITRIKYTDNTLGFGTKLNWNI